MQAKKAGAYPKSQKKELHMKAMDSYHQLDLAVFIVVYKTA